MSLAWSIMRSGLGWTDTAWRERRIGDVVELVNGYPFDSSTFGPVGDMPLVRIRDLTQPEFETFVSGEIPQRVILRNGDLVIGMDGEFNVVRWQRGPAALNQRLCLLRPRPEVDIRFVYYWLPALLGILNNLAYSTTVKHLSSSEVLSERILLPPLEEQRRIADFLDAQVTLLDEAIELRKRQAELLDEQFQALVSGLYQEAGERAGFIRLGLRLRGLEQGWSPQCEDRLTDPGEYGVLKAGCVNGGTFRAEQHKALPSSVEPRLQYLVSPGDVLMSRASGSLDLIGSVAVVPISAPGNLILCDKVYRLQPERNVDPDWLAYMLAAHEAREAIKLGSSGAAGMANNLPSGTVKALLIPAASFDEQQVDAARLKERQRQLTETQGLLALSLSLLEEQRQALIIAAVTGQFDVTTAGSVA